MFCLFRFDACLAVYIWNTNSNYQCDKARQGIVQVVSIISGNPYPAFYRCAKPICNRFFFLWHTKSNVDWICYVRNSKTHPFRLQTVFQLLNHASSQVPFLSENKGSFLAFFFNTAVTVSLLIDRTLPISRTPLLLRVSSIICSFMPCLHALYR